MNAISMKGNKMKVEKGQILEGINPYTGEKEYFKYHGNEEEQLASKGIKRKLKQKGIKGIIIVSNEWIKAHKIKVHIKGEINE